MIKKINIEEIKKREEFLYGKLLTRKEVEYALEEAKASVKRNMEYLNGKFPFSAAYNSEPFPSERDGMYPITENVEWTTGFWTGLIWLMYDWSREECFKELGMADVRSFKERVEKRIDLNHHDLGFLYSPSCVAAYQLCQSEEGKQAALQAADILMERYRENGHFIQAWGNVGDPKDYRLIIDCLLNLPLLYWASEVTGNPDYADKAENHIRTAMKCVMRPDCSTYHTYFINTVTGEPDHGVTHQGNRDGSAWARGQAWGIYGSAFAYKFLREDEYADIFCKVTDYFLKHLPKDMIPYWDFDFSDGSAEPRDSSAAAIAACGMLEMSKYLPEEKAAYYTGMAKRLLHALVTECAVTDPAQSNGQLLHGTYARSTPYNTCFNIGVDECVLWGDYFWYKERLLIL